MTEIGSARSVGAGLTGFFATLPSLMPSEARDTADTVTALIAGLLPNGRSSDLAVAATGRTRHDAMRAYVRHRLQDVTLDAEVFRAAFGVNRATLYRALRDAGGVSFFK
ncbi:MAG: hypothetical protein AAF830_17630 [Pseudomonadota bacterium]